MDQVYVLQHEYELHGQDSAKLIGVYGSRAEAMLAIERLKTQPGFRDWPDAFSIDRYRVGEDHWTEGFCRLVHLHLPSSGSPGRYQVAGAVWLPGGRYRLSSITSPEDTDFAIGDRVACEERRIGSNDRALVAVPLPPERGTD